MAISNYRTSVYQLKNPLSRPFHAFILTFLVSLTRIVLATGLYFNLSDFPVGGQDINCTGDAFPADGVIQLTGNLRTAQMNTRFGRATYHKPLHLWEANNVSGSTTLTDFTTHFSFVIDAAGNTTYGDGLAFFLAPNGSSLPPKANLTRGRTLGLTWDNQELNTSMNHFVAVEFDIFGNVFDPTGRHVGIDINSMKSVNTVKLFCNVTAGEKCHAWIDYNSATHNLSVVFGSENQHNFSGRISHIVNLRDYLPEWVTFGFSGSTGTYFATHTISSWEFNSTLMDDVTNTTGIGPVKDNVNMRPLFVGLWVGAAAGFVTVVGLVLYVILRRKRRDKDEEVDSRVLQEYIDDEFERGTGPRKFSYNELAQATNNFREEHKLGEGGFGRVYKGFLKDMNAYVAVKRVSRCSNQGIKSYAAEVKIITRLRHRNLVQLIGWCHERKELLLVYEFLPNGSLDSHLFKEKSMLTWSVRFEIVRGLASGLLYLHEEWEQCVVHRDVKPSNIVLDSDFNAKLADFGLARLVDHIKGSQTTALAGTMGYIAPECATSGKASKESDVYSFGVVLLEIASGRRPVFSSPSGGDEMYIVEWVWELYGMGKLLEAADPKLFGDFDVHQMERLMMVGLLCAHPDASFRPSMRKAIQLLNFETPLPVLPSKMPVATYSASPAQANTPWLLHPCDITTTEESEGGWNQSSSFTRSSMNSSQLNPSD